jgi:CRISPR system Cascade subunit CasA
LNLLTDSLLRVVTLAGETSMHLPRFLEALGRDEVESLPSLQRHQEDAFHVFVCYLAAAVLARTNEKNPVQEASYWRNGLYQLAEGNEAAWTLVVDDLSQPAFMQPPLPQADHGRLQLSAQTPDELDLLPTAKNHELKKARAAHPSLDKWVYALISLQTMSGFFGRGNQGISRMNSGFGNRPIVEIIHERRLGKHWHDAVIRLGIHRTQVLEGPWGYASNGLVLVWLKEWDGKIALPIQELDPFYLEICRRLRLRNCKGKLLAAGISADYPRIATKELSGNLGDAWTPVDLANKKGVSALTVGSAGITASLLRRLIFRDQLALTALHKPLSNRPGDVWLLASVLVRGQGTTDGFHERWVRIPGQSRTRLFGPRDQRESLAALSKTAIDFAGEVQNRVLKPAVFAFLEGAPDKLQFDRDSAQTWWKKAQRRYEEFWSDSYFSWLWSVPGTFEAMVEQRRWLICLRDHASEVLRETIRTMPTHSGRRYRARTQTERVFWGALNKHFPQLKEESHGATENH